MRANTDPIGQKPGRTLTRTVGGTAGAALLLCGAHSSLAAPAVESKKPSTLSYSASLAVKETFDDNLFLQHEDVAPAEEAFITTVIPRIGLSLKPADIFGADLTYTPEVNFIHSDLEEDFTTHRAGLVLGGKGGDTTWKVTENFVWINGSKEGPSYFGPGGAPATGGPQIRDRREAVVQRGGLEVKQTFGDWFARPVVAGYLHNFRAIQRLTPGYQNFVDRSDWNAGIDIGRTVTQGASAFAGYRYGRQDQSTLFTDPTQYDSRYHRALAGIEGKPFTWLQLTATMGPEFRKFGPDVAATFDSRDEMYLYVDASAVISPTSSDTIAFSAKRFEQPGFGGRSVYIDATYDLTWKHKFSPSITTSLGLRGYQTKFLGPARRDDWIVSPNAVFTYSFNKDLSMEVSYVYDRAYSVIPEYYTREYDHQLISLGLRYVFH